MSPWYLNTDNTGRHLLEEKLNTHSIYLQRTIAYLLGAGRKVPGEEVLSDNCSGGLTGHCHALDKWHCGDTFPKATHSLSHRSTRGHFQQVCRLPSTKRERRDKMVTALTFVDCKCLHLKEIPAQFNTDLLESSTESHEIQEGIYTSQNH